MGAQAFGGLAGRVIFRKLFKFLSGITITVVALHGETVIHPDRTFCIKVIDAEDNLVEVLTDLTSGASAGLSTTMACST
jgi:hypothetical protein